MEVVDELCKRSGLLGCATYCVGGKGRDVPVRVMNVCPEPVVIHKGQSLAEFTEATALDGLDRRPVGKSSDIYNPMVDIDLGESLSSDEKQQLENLLKRHQDVFAYPGNEGYSVDVEHTIPLTTKTPIACRPRLLPTRWKAEVEDEVRRLR